jgi:hypothetical protein
MHVRAMPRRIAGMKRCPKSQDHRFKCTSSNEVDQVGVLEDCRVTIPLTHTTHRHGWPDPDKLWWQGAKPHGELAYGHAGKTIGQWGCGLCAVAAAARLAGVRAGATPTTVQAAAMQASPPVWAADSSLAVMPRLARAAGLSCLDAGERWSVVARPERPAMTVADISRAVCDAIDHHGLTAPVGFGWLHVDYTGDDRGDHWILAFAYDDRWAYCYCSMKAGVVRLSRTTLKGAGYTVVGGYPLGV